MEVEEAKQQTRNAFANRAMLYYYIFDEMRKELGKERAKEMFVRGIRRRGTDIGLKYAEAAESGDFARVAQIFKTDSPCEGELFEPAVLEVDERGCTLTMSACPLVDAWRDLGLDDDEVALMCQMAAQIDFATFESAGLELHMNETIGEGHKMCKLVLRRR